MQKSGVTVRVAPDKKTLKKSVKSRLNSDKEVIQLFTVG